MLRSMKPLWRTVAVSLLLALAAFRSYAIQEPAASAQALEFFEKRVRPVLAQNCWRCHGPAQQQSSLRLDGIDRILAGGKRGPAVVPGQPDQSRLIRALRYEDPELQMPPVGKLEQQQIADLTAWVAMGAPWPASVAPAPAPESGASGIIARRETHWAWQPLRRTEPPSAGNSSWPRNAIDNFILSRLQREGLTPAPPADRRTLLRRVYFDLIGLPPDPAAVDAFLSDQTPDAYERIVDSLLASPRFGERWGRHWLDLVRYAETYGHEFDYPIPHPWRYRDYVIRAINADLPYDRFVTEHLAGDQLPNPRINPEEETNESILGTGFWFFGQATHSPVDVRQDEAERIDNQIDVMTKAFLGLTVACARCHDHKFDAITAADYYALAGFLQSSRMQEAFFDPHRKIAKSVAALEELHRKRGALVTKLLPEPEATISVKLGPHLLAAHEVMYGTPRLAEAFSISRSEIVIDDFENEAFGRWKLEGEAFGKGPSGGGQKKAEGFQGKQLVSSFTTEPKTGRMISEPFLLSQPFLRFLIGGRGAENRLGVRLLADNRVVMRATVVQNDKLRPVQWDLMPFHGKKITVEILDDDPSGYILVDHLVLSNRQDEMRDRRSVPVVAREAGLDPLTLERWVMALQDRDSSTILYPLHAIAQPSSEVSGQKSTEGFLSRREQAYQNALAKSEPAELFESFDEGHFRKWFVTGEAFGKAPTSLGQTDPRLEGWGFTPPGLAHSGLIADKLQGALRSETFTIKKKKILYRLAGSGGQIRLIIDGYVMDVYNPLLFKGVSFNVNTGDRFVWHTQAQDVGNYIGHRAHIEILDLGDGYVAVDEIRFSDQDPPKEDVNPLALKMLGDKSLSSKEDIVRAYERIWTDSLRASRSGTIDQEHQEFLGWMMRNRLIEPSTRFSKNKDGESQLTAMNEAIRQQAGSVAESLRVLAIVDGSPKDEYLFFRGSYKNQGPYVPRRFLEAIAGRDQPRIPQGSGRLELARRMFDSGNPFPARVMVNRVWHHLFGRGIVPSTDNFGALGEKPSHPELLDHLAFGFMQDGWSIKRLIRNIVISNTYRMSSGFIDPAAAEKDPSNALLHRMSVRRLEAETIRDTILSVSGRLDTTMYGPPIPVHLTPFMDGRGRPKQSGPLDGAGRRSIYQEVRRNFLSPMMLAFDTPIPHSTIGRRTVSNVPAQALILMNEPFVVEQAQAWAKRLLAREKATVSRRIERLFLEALGRPPDEVELRQMTDFLRQQADSYGLSATEQETSEALWSDLCHTILNLKEFIFVR